MNNEKENNELNTSPVNFIEGQIKPVISLQTSVDIPAGTDLNHVGEMSQRDTGQQDEHGILSKEVFDNLPDLLREICRVLTSQNDREVVLVGALGVISGVLPNYRTHYNGKEVEPNLYCYILASYGVGKGSLEYARKLVEPIHLQKRLKFDYEQEMYKVQNAQYEKALKLHERDKKGEIELPEKPVPPFNHMLFIPANNSKTGLYQLLNENNGRGILFETEGDTLADSIKQDYGNFSDGLRKAFHHEPISFFRRANSEFVEIREPYLSVVLSSTQDQLLKLIPTPENGLFSRFLYYELQANSKFDDVFDHSKNEYNELFKVWGQRVQFINDFLESLEKPYWFELQNHQKKAFLEEFQHQKDELLEFVNNDIGGTVNRLGIICIRIAMILSALRQLDMKPLTEKIICTDQDFENAIRITKILKLHTLSVYWKLNKLKVKANETLKKLIPDDPLRDKYRQTCIELSKQGMSVRKISMQLFGSENKKSTIFRWITEKP